MAQQATTEAIYVMGLKADQVLQTQQQVDRGNKQIADSFEQVEQTTERVTAATRTTADGFARLEARYDPLIRAEQRRQAALEQANRYLQQGTVNQERYAAQIQRVNAYYDQQVAAIQRGLAANNNFNSAAGAGVGIMSRYGNTIRQAGFQVGDFAVQLASGTNPIVAFTQQGSQLIQIFGPIGAALGAVVSIAGAVAVGMMGMKDSTADAKKEAQEYEKALGNMNDTLLTSAEASAYAAAQKRGEALATLQATQAKRGEKVAELELQAARRQADVQNLQRGRIGAALDRSLGTNAPQPVAGQAEADAAAVELARARQEVDDLQAQLDALADPSRSGSARERAEKLSEYIEGLKREVQLTAMTTEERKIQAELDKARKEFNIEVGSTLDKQVESLIRQSAANEKIQKQDEDRIKFTQRIIDMLDEDARKTEEAANKRNVAVEKYIQGLENAATAEEASGVEKKIQLATIEAQNKLIDEQGNKVRDLTEEEKKRIDAAVRQKDQIEQQNKAYEKLTKDIERTAERTLDRIADAGGDIIFDAWQNKSADLWQTFEQYAKRALAQIAAEFLTQNLLGSLVRGAVSSAPGLFGISSPTVPKSFYGNDGISGGSSGIGVGDAIGLGNLLASGGIGVPQFAKEAIFSALAGIDGTGAFAVDLINGLGASPWGIIGGLAANLLGLGSKNPIINFASGTVGAIGGATIGSSIGGTLLGIGAGPLGAIAGAFLGTVLGGLFGGGNKGYSGGQVNLAVDPNGQLVTTEARFKRYDDAGATQSAKDFVAQVNQAFAQLGLKFTPQGNFTNITFGQESFPIEDTIARLFGAGGIQSGNSQLDQLIRNLDQSGGGQATFERLSELVTTFRTIEQIKNPAGETVDVLKQINEQFDKLAESARKFGLDLTAVEKGRQQAIDQYNLINPSGTNYRLTAGLPFYQAAGSIVDFLNAQSLSGTSSLSPQQQLVEVQRQFGDVLARVRGGDIGSVNTLTSLAGAGISLGRNLYGSTAQGTSLEQMFRSSLLSVADLISSDSFVDKQIAAISQQTQIQQQGVDQMVKAIGELKRELQLLRSQVAANSNANNQIAVGF